MKISIVTPPDFDFVQCVTTNGWRQLAPFSWDAESKILQRVEQFDDRLVALLAVSSNGSDLLVECDAEVDEQHLRSGVITMLQLDLPMSNFHDYCKNHPKLAHVPSLCQGRLLRSPSVFEDVVKVIATTNTTWVQTKAMVGRIVDNFGSPHPADETKRAFPTQEEIANIPFSEFADKAKMGYRNGSVHRIASEVAAGKLDLESLRDPSIPSVDLYKRLLTLPGIGPYAASCLMIYLGRYDRVNVDSWARTLVGRELGRKVTDKEVHEFFEPYGEWKALVYHYYPWKNEALEY